MEIDVKLPDLPNPCILKCKVDTGEQGNVLPLRTFKKMFANMMDRNTPVYGSLVQQAPFVKLQACNGSEILQVGKIGSSFDSASPVTGPFLSFSLRRLQGQFSFAKETSKILRIITINYIPDMTIRVMHNITQETVGIQDKESSLEFYRQIYGPREVPWEISH